MSEAENTTRVNKFIAHANGLSRREVDNAITSGRVTINDKTAGLGAHIKPTDIVAFDGKIISAQQNYTYLMLNKPVGYVCSRKQQGEFPTIYELLPEEYRPLKPVGRLDKDSSGLLLLSNDGDFAQKMTHPSNHKQKTYEITLDKDLEPLHQQMINDYGIELEDGNSKLILERLNDINRTDWRVMMHEGRNRQIRRTFDALGYSVVKLYRTHFGQYKVEDLEPSDFRVVDLM